MNDELLERKWSTNVENLNRTPPLLPEKKKKKTDRY